MAVVLNDSEIERLVATRKELPPDYQSRLALKPKRGHKEQELELKTEDGDEFRVVLRQSDFNPLDFSVILGYRIPKSNRVFRLRRYNGRHGEHSNRLEGERFDDYHIHMATERYQQSGFKEDTYARPTSRYADFRAAIRCLIDDCGFVEPAGTQTEMVMDR